MFWSFVRDNTLTKLLFCLNQYGVHRMLTFYVTRIGCGIAGFTDAEIAPLFMKARSLNNVRIPESFDLILNEMI